MVTATDARTRLAAAQPHRDVAHLADLVGASGFGIVRGAEMRDLLGSEAVAGAAAFAASWNDLPIDEYMGDGGRYRRRRHAVYSAEAGGLTREPHQPHYQSLRDNPLNGGIARWFEPILPEIGAGPTLRSAVDLLVAVAGRRRPSIGRWRVEAHQFRIDARAGEAGKPTPEGVHRDGVDFVLVMLVGRRNAAHGVTTIVDASGATLVDVRLSEPFDAMVLDDARVRHGVSPIEPVDPARPAIRDALVVTVAAR